MVHRRVRCSCRRGHHGRSGAATHRGVVGHHEHETAVEPDSSSFGSTIVTAFQSGRLVDGGANDLTRLEGRPARGEAIEIHGRVTQEDGAPMDNLVLEIWQADCTGIFRDPVDPRHADADPNFFGWGRAATDANGVYRFRTIKPGPVKTATPAGKARRKR